MSVTPGKKTSNICLIGKTTLIVRMNEYFLFNYALMQLKHKTLNKNIPKNDSILTSYYSNTWKKISFNNGSIQKC